MHLANYHSKLKFIDIGAIYVRQIPIRLRGVAQSVTYPSADNCLTADQEIVSSLRAWSHCD